jgi:hypothetical protein
LPKEISTKASPRLPLRVWYWILLGLGCAGLYALYSPYALELLDFLPKPVKSAAVPLVTEEAPEAEEVEQMGESTAQDLQTLPMAQETAEDTIAMGDAQNDELVQIFEAQEKTPGRNPVAADPKSKKALASKRSLGLA